jgi:putative membrane protein
MPVAKLRIGPRSNCCIDIGRQIHPAPGSGSAVSRTIGSIGPRDGKAQMAERMAAAVTEDDLEWGEHASASATTESPNLNVLNTLMSLDRTLMSWIRTSLSFYSFGFALYKILAEVREAGRLQLNDNAPRNYGLLLILTGTVAMVMGTGQYWLTLNELRQLQPIRFARGTFLMALWMCFTGVFLFGSVLIRLL